MSSARRVLESAVEALMARDEERFVSLGSPGIELRAPGGLDFEGREGLRQWYRLWTQGFPDCSVRYHNLVGNEAQVMGEGVFKGTQTGVMHLPTGDVPPTGRSATLEFAAVVRAEDGRLTYLRHYLDVIGLMAQLGLMGAPVQGAQA